jgi:hypothetical protein
MRVNGKSNQKLTVALGLLMHVKRVQHQPAQILPLQRVTQPQDSRLIRCRRNAYRSTRTSLAPVQARAVEYQFSPVIYAGSQRF